RSVLAVHQREQRWLGKVEPEDQLGRLRLDELHVYLGRVDSIVGHSGGGVKPQAQLLQIEPEIDAPEEFPPGVHAAQRLASLHIASALPLVKIGDDAVEDRSDEGGRLADRQLRLLA